MIEKNMKKINNNQKNNRKRYNYKIWKGKRLLDITKTMNKFFNKGIKVNNK